MVNEIFSPEPIIGATLSKLNGPDSAAKRPPMAEFGLQPGPYVNWGNSGSLLASHQGYGTYPIDASFQKPRRRPMPELRKHVNLLAVVAAIVLPLLLFAVVCATLSFSLHHTHPSAARAIVLLGFLAVLGLFAQAQEELQRRRVGDANAQVAGYGFLFITCLAAWLLGAGLGFVNFNVNMLGVYEVSGLKTYVGVDPAVNRGQQMMDAGRVVFAEGVQLDLSRASAFTSASTVYCVAPIADGAKTPLAAYDFWVAGENCCSPRDPQHGFRCGAAMDSDANSGVRITGAHDYYDLAIQQAEAAHDLQAVHPLLFRWTHDPVAETAAQQSAGFRMYYLGILMFLALQIALVGCGALVVQAKLQQEQENEPRCF